MKRPETRDDFVKFWPKFQAWLIANGSAIYQPTNAYEIARFMSAEGTGVIYVNGRDRISSFANGAEKALECFLTGQTWRAVPKKRRGSGQIRREREFKALVLRDGSGCFYCTTPLTVETATIEHLVAVTSQGSNHLANKALACEPCNKQAGHKSVKEKLDLAISKRVNK